MAGNAIIVGNVATCARVEQQLALLDDPPHVVGWVTVPPGAAGGSRLLGNIDDLETIVTRHRPDLVLVSLSSVMTELVASIRMRLWKLGVPDRFLPTLEDQLAGVGPRTHLDIDLTQLVDRPPRRVDETLLRSVLENRRVLITGAGGSIGSELARIAVRHEPAQLVLVDRSENALFEIDRQVAMAAPRLSRRALLHDVVDRAGTLRQFLELAPEIVLHAAAHKHVPMMEDHPAAAIDNNFFGTVSAADAAATAGAERFVMISTDKAVHPSSTMGATKRLAELYVQHLQTRSDTAFSMVRFGNVLGSSGSVLQTWADQITRGGPLTVTHPAMTRYFMSIPEAAILVMQAAALHAPDAPSGEVFVLDMGEPVPIVDLARRYAAAHGLEAVTIDEATHAPRPGTIALVFTGPRPGEKLHEQLACDVEALRPTRHPDINIWAAEPPDERSIQAMLTALAPGGRPDTPDALTELLRGLVPEMVEPVTA